MTMNRLKNIFIAGMLMMLPAPIWFAVADVLLYVPGALLGVKLGGGFAAKWSPTVQNQ